MSSKVSATDLSEEKLKQEKEAQKRKADAISYLQAEGQSMKTISSELHAQNTKNELKDNTLELLMKEKLKKELAAKTIKTMSVVQHTSLTTENNAMLPEHWQKVLDPSSNKYYYWNKVTNVTAWELPKQTLVDSSSGDKGKEGWEDEWDKVVHASTNQVFYVNKITKEKVSTKPVIIVEEKVKGIIDKSEDVRKRNIEDVDNATKKQKVET